MPLIFWIFQGSEYATDYEHVWRPMCQGLQYNEKCLLEQGALIFEIEFLF